jgi:hypothetical protein
MPDNTDTDTRNLGHNLQKLVDSGVLSMRSARQLSIAAREKIEEDLKPAEIEAMINIYKVMGSTQPYTPDSDGGCL